MKNTEKKIQENFGKIQKRFEGLVAFEDFAQIRSHVNENEKQNKTNKYKSAKIANSTFQKSDRVLL